MIGCAGWLGDGCVTDTIQWLVGKVWLLWLGCRTSGCCSWRTLCSPTSSSAQKRQSFPHPSCSQGSTTASCTLGPCCKPCQIVSQSPYAYLLPFHPCTFVVHYILISLIHDKRDTAIPQKHPEFSLHCLGLFVWFRIRLKHDLIELGVRSGTGREHVW